MIIIGCILGFIYFLYQLETPSMGNILFRINSDGVKELSLGSVWNMILAPFMYINFWTKPELLSVNWIITTFIGGIGSMFFL